LWTLIIGEPDMPHLSRILLALLVLGALLGGAANAPPPTRAAPSWTPAAPLGTARAGHAAVLLPDGQVLVVGGDSAGGAAASAERYDPATDRWAPAASLGGAFGSPVAAPLADGRVLLVGAVGEIGTPAAGALYTPATDTWTPAAPTPLPPGGTLTALRDGRALLVAGGNAAVYDPATGAWTATGPLGARAGGNRHAATPLPDGRVLVTGGIRGDCGKTGCLNATAERYDPATNAWTPVAPMRAARAAHQMVALATGQVLVVGSYGDSREPERYDPATDTWAAAGQLPFGFITGGQTLTALPDGRALLVTATFGPSSTPVSAAALYDPATDGWQPVAAPGIPRSGHSATPLRDGRVLVAGGGYGGGASAELYGEARQVGACFAETGRCLADPFLAYWQQHGGLAQFGFPLTDERWETLEDGRPYVVQYFERARFERHPENAPPYDVLLGQFGRQLYLLDPAFPRANAADPLPGAAYFAETGHNVRGRFLDYWGANGGLAQFGLPLSEEIRERLEDGQDYTVQYFERARLELHPESAAPYDVLLGQFGRRILAAREPVGPLPYPPIARFAPAYAANSGVRARLNLPTGPEARVPGAIQQFQGGWMLWRGDTRTIYVLTSEASGGSIPVGAAQAFPDTWAEGQPVGGGPGPVPTLSEPGRGFGQVWRAHPEIRERLGYALTPAEQGQTLTVQPFVGGVALDAPEQATYGPRGATFIVYTNGRYETQSYAP